MTFCSDEQNKNEIIEKIISDGYNYEINYLDGNSVSYICNDENHLEEKEKIMIEQALEREKLEYQKTKNNSAFSFLMWFISNVSFQNVYNDNFKIIFYIIAIIFIYNYLKNKRRLNEMKKYKILLDNYKLIQNNPEITKFIEFDSIYRNPINIFNIDDYTLSDMKIIKRELSKKQCN